MTLCHGTFKLLTSYNSIKFCVFIFWIRLKCQLFLMNYTSNICSCSSLLLSFLFIYVQYNLVHLKKLSGKFFFFNYSFSKVFFFQMPLTLFSRNKIYVQLFKKNSNEKFMPNVLVFHVLKFSILCRKESYANKMDKLLQLAI